MILIPLAATSGGDIEETALNTNLEAVEECARQLRLRDIGGLVVIDLIDMSAVSNRQKVEQHLTDILQKRDPARIQVGRISRFGLLEMSRQRLRPTLGESSQEICPRCLGEGHIRGIEPLALAIMRILSEQAMNGDNIELRAFAPIKVASYLMNEKRSTITKIEQNCDVKIVIIPASDIETPHYHIECITEDSITSSTPKSSYELNYTFTEFSNGQYPTSRDQTPAVANILTQGPAMNVNLVKRLWHTVFGSETKETAEPDVATPPQASKRERNTRSPSRSRTRDSGSSSSRRNSKDKDGRSTTKSRVNKERNTSNKRSSQSSTTAKDQKESSSRSRKSSSSRTADKNTPAKRGEKSRNQSSRSTEGKRTKSSSSKTTVTQTTTTDADLKQLTSNQPVDSKNTAVSEEKTTITETKARSRRQTRRQRTTKGPARKISGKTQTTKKDIAEPQTTEDTTDVTTLAKTDQVVKVDSSTPASTTQANSTPTEITSTTDKQTTPKPRASRRRGRYVRIQKGARPRAKSETKAESKETTSEEKSE